MTEAGNTAAKRWMDAWREAGKELESIRRAELRALDPLQAVAALSGTVDFFSEPFRARPTSGLVEQQRWFSKARRD
jgi:hypothetical protein